MPKRSLATFFSVAISATVLVGCTTAAATPAVTVNPGECDPATVTIHPMSLDGVSLRVAVPGPDRVQIDVWDTFEHRRLSQQVSIRGGGADFALWSFNGDFERIEVASKSGGTCEISQGVLDELNQ